jgi:hypothetical protein
LKQVAAIGLRLEHVLNNHRDMRSDLSYYFHDNSNNIEPCRICDEVSGGNNNKVACIIGLGSVKIYCLAKQIYLQGLPELCKQWVEIKLLLLCQKIANVIDYQQETIKM